MKRQPLPGIRRAALAVSMPAPRPLVALLAGLSMSGWASAQTAAEPQPPAGGEAVLPAVRAKATAEPTGKETLRPSTSAIGKGQQALRDIPQSLTVVTEKLLDDATSTR